MKHCWSCPWTKGRCKDGCVFGGDAGLKIIAARSRESGQRVLDDAKVDPELVRKPVDI